MKRATVVAGGRAVVVRGEVSGTNLCLPLKGLRVVAAGRRVM